MCVWEKRYSCLKLIVASKSDAAPQQVKHNDTEKSQIISKL